MNLRDSIRRRRGAPQVPAATLPGPDWVQPWWLARQRDPESAAYHPGGGTPVNAVGRSWTLVGNLDSPRRTAVDRRGLVAARPGAWSLDWWVRAEEQWIFPSQTPGVRQRLIDGAPVVETIVRAAGGEVVHRVYATRVDGDALVIEVENQASGPVALAIAVRPYDLQGGGRICSIELDGRTVSVDGEPAIVFGREPGDFVVGTGGVDPARVLDDSIGSLSSVSCEQGRASAAVVFPLVHGTTLRVVVSPPAAVAGKANTVDRQPAAQQVARGWGQHAVSAARVVLPPGRVSDAFDAARQSLLLAHVGGELDPVPYGPPSRPGDDLLVLDALGELGYHGAVREVLIDRGRRQNALGAIRGADTDVTATTLLALERALLLAPDVAFADALSEVVADGTRWLLAHQELPYAAEALHSAHRSLERIGATSAAGELAAVLPALPTRNVPEPQTSNDSDLLFEDRIGPRGVAVLATAQVCVAEATTSPALAWARLERVLDVAGPTWSWPTHAHPKLGTGTGGSGHDLRVTACVARTVRSLLVDDSRVDELRLCGHWPVAWLGQGVEVHGLPSAHGKVSWAVRWHGDRPALLWEVESGADDLLVTAPGLDEGWRGRGSVGEALLGAIEAPRESATGGLSDPPDDGNEMNLGGSFE